jgi:hypothetical protein
VNGRESFGFLPFRDVHDLGPCQINIYLYPADGHVSAVRVTLPVVDSGAGIVRVVLTHPVKPGELKVAPGLIEVESGRGSSSNLFSVGAVATLRWEPIRSICQLDSPAPILLEGKSLFDDDLNPVDLFTNELQAWMSIMRARAKGNQAAYNKLLVRIPPYTLYAYGLLLAAKRLSLTPIDERNERYWRATNQLNGALKAARQHATFPNPMPNLELLLTVD